MSATDFIKIRGHSSDPGTGDPGLNECFQGYWGEDSFSVNTGGGYSGTGTNTEENTEGSADFLSTLIDKIEGLNTQIEADLRNEGSNEGETREITPGKKRGLPAIIPVSKILLRGSSMGLIGYIVETIIKEPKYAITISQAVQAVESAINICQDLYDMGEHALGIDSSQEKLASSLERLAGKEGRFLDTKGLFEKAFLEDEQSILARSLLYTDPDSGEKASILYKAFLTKSIGPDEAETIESFFEKIYEGIQMLKFNDVKLDFGAFKAYLWSLIVEK